MAAFENARLEKLAQGLASGLPPHEATKAAGFSRQSGMTRKRVARADIVARVEEIGRARIEKAADIVPLIEQLTTLATDAGKLGSGAGMMAAHALLAEAARLKALLAPPSRGYGVPGGVRPAPDLTKEEWLAAFAPNHRKPV